MKETSKTLLAIGILGLVCALVVFQGCVVLTGTSGEDTWSLGIRNDNALVITRRALKNSEGKEEASASMELKINQGILDAILSSKPGGGTAPDSE